MGIKFDTCDLNDVELLASKTKELSQMFNGKDIYVNSILNSSIGEQYTNYNKFKVSDIQFGPIYLYIYGPGRDRIILRLENIMSIETTENSFKIERVFNEFNHEFKITLA